jgi:hypothetical protein
MLEEEEDEEAEEKEEAKKEEELTEEFTTIKTPHHSGIIRRRDLGYKNFNKFFTEEIARIFTTYDKERLEEHKYKENWIKNVEILRKKQSLSED